MNVCGPIRGLYVRVYNGVGRMMERVRLVNCTSNVLGVIRKATNLFPISASVFIIMGFRNDTSTLIAKFLYRGDYRKTICATTRYCSHFFRLCLGLS